MEALTHHQAAIPCSCSPEVQNVFTSYCMDQAGLLTFPPFIKPAQANMDTCASLTLQLNTTIQSGVFGLEHTGGSIKIVLGHECCRP